MKKSEKNLFSFETIERVEFEKLPGNEYWLNFTMENYRYDFKVQKGYDGRQRVYHREEHDAKQCPFCSGEFTMCLGLTNKSEELLNVLVQHPNIRLRWLVKPQ